MGFLDSMPDYEATQIPDRSPDLDQALANNTALANENPGAYADKLNYGIEKSNLFDNHPENPQSVALSARAKQYYDTNVNQVKSHATPMAAERQSSMQLANVDQHAANFSNRQSRASINFKEVTFQRGAAIQQEANRRVLLTSLFGGLGKVGGALIAQGAWNANHRTPTELGGTESVANKMQDNYAGNNFRMATDLGIIT